MGYKKYYNNKTKTLDGNVFDSRKEASRWEKLCILEKAGVIRDLKRQVAYELIPAQYETYERYSKTGRRLKDGRKCIEKACSYVADFTYIQCDTGELVVEDTKGIRTKDYIIKRKLMLLIHGIKIYET